MEAKSLIYEFDGIRVEAGEAQAFRDGRRLAIEPKAFRVLVYLLEHRGQLVRKEELRAAVWAETHVTENAVARAVAVLRRSLGDNKEEPKYIQTVPTLGYRFVAEVVERETPVTELVGYPRGSWWLRGAAVCAILMVPALIWWRTPSGGKNEFRSIQVTSSLGLDIDPTFSPDGNTLAFASDQSGSFEIYAKDLHAASGRRLTSDGQRNLQPAWSPDGSTIAFYSQGHGGLWLMPAGGGAAHRLTTFGSSPAWSPDGREIVFQSGGVRDLSELASVSMASSNLWIVRVADGAVRPLTRMNQPKGAHNSPAWSPDGRSVVFVVNSFVDELSLWQVEIGSGRLEHIPEPSGIFEPVYDPSGRSLLFGSTRNFGIWELPLSRMGRLLRRQRHLSAALPGTTIDRYLAISLDGRHIAFSRVVSSSNLYALRLDSPRGEIQPLAVTADTRRRKSRPAVSPDGSRVLFWVSSAEPGSGTWLANLDGSGAHPVAPGCSQAQWLGPEDFACTSHASIWKVHLPSGARQRLGGVPDSAEFVALRGAADSVAFMASDRGAPNVWLAGLSSGEARQVTFDAESAGFPAWSPDGRELAVEVKRGDSANVYTLNSGGELRAVTHDSGQNWPYSWSPDGSRIAFAAMRGGVWNVWWAARDGRREEQLTHYEGPRHYVRYPAWSPTGNAIVYEYGETRGNIWALVQR